MELTTSSASSNRLTLIVGNAAGRNPWASSVLHVHSVHAMQRAAAFEDVERVILDRSATPVEFLRLLAALPPHIAGDVMLIGEDGGAFLSSVGRGGDRVLYALSSEDVAFYFETNGLTCTRPF